MAHLTVALDLIESPHDELEEVDVEGWRAWLPKDVDRPRFNTSEARIHLLPQFDCYVVGCHPRKQLIPESCPELQRGTAAPFPALLKDGTVAGLWAANAAVVSSKFALERLLHWSMLIRNMSSAKRSVSVRSSRRLSAFLTVTLRQIATFEARFLRQALGSG